MSKLQFLYGDQLMSKNTAIKPGTLYLDCTTNELYFDDPSGKQQLHQKVIDAATLLYEDGTPVADGSAVIGVLKMRNGSTFAPAASSIFDNNDGGVLTISRSATALSNPTYLVGWDGNTMKPVTCSTLSVNYANTAGALSDIVDTDKASATEIQRRVWFSWNDNKKGRPAYDDNFTYQASTGTVTAKIFKGSLKGTADRSKYLETWKTETSNGTYGSEFPLYAWWESGSVCKLVVDNYATKVDTANTAGALTTNAGSSGQAIYFANGVPVALDWRIGNKDVGEHNCNNVTYNFSGHYTSNGPSTDLGASTADGALWSQAHSSTWVAQIAQDYRNGNLFVRGKNNGTWQGWKAVLTNENFASVLDGRYVNVSGDTMSGALNMNNNKITGIGDLAFADPGANEGITWTGGNGWWIYESPDDLTSDKGNLQFVQGTTRCLTMRTDGVIDIPSGVMTPYINMKPYQAGDGKAKNWYRIWTADGTNASGQAHCVFTISRNYCFPQNESYTFVVSVGYKGDINITQLSGVKGSPQIPKIRVVYKNNENVYIDFYGDANADYENTYYVSGFGYGKFQTPTVTSATVESGYTSYEFTTMGGMKTSGSLSVGGLITTTSATTHAGIKVGDVYINAISGNLILQNLGALRFGSDAWDCNQWAGLKYDHNNKYIYLGLADNTIFTANAAQSNGRIFTPGIAYFHVGNQSTYYMTDGGAIHGSVITFPATAASLNASSPMSITYGKIAAYGTLTINANTDNSGTEYVLLTAGKGLSNTLTDGLAIGTSTLQWQGSDVSTSTTKIVDASGQNTSTYYPVVISIPHGGLRRIKLAVQLDSGTVPSWSTHSAGFTTNIDVEIIAAGWGTVSSNRYIKYQDDYNFASVKPAYFVGQLSNESRAVFYVRGGGKYRFVCSWQAASVSLRTAETDYSGQKVAPTTSTPALINGTKTTVETNIDGNAATATTLQTARTIQTNLASTSSASFNGSENITPGVTGILGVANGGTGKTLWEARQLVYSSGPGRLANANIYYDSNKLRPMSTNTISLGSSSYVWKGVYATTFYASSDIRKKKEITDLIVNRDILSLPLYQFKYIDNDDEDTHIGCMAQDLQQICPELVTADTDGYLSIKENRLVYILLDRMKKMQEEIRVLKEERQNG